MISDKKLTFVGPPGVGKTTIKEIYFDKGDPLTLLENPLLPSRGVNSSVYSLFNSNLGILDLAGQENDFWFSESGKEVFNESSIIICIFDIMNSTESIIKFLVNVYQIIKELNLHSCKIIAFLHKIDLVSPSYVDQKIKAIKKFITIQHPRGGDFEIFKTSIGKDFFYDTYNIILNVLNSIIHRDLIPISKQEFLILKKELSIILQSDHISKYNTDYLVDNYDLDLEEAHLHMQRLEHLGFINNFDNFTFFKLTNKAYYYKVGWEKEQLNTEESKENKNIELFHIFLYLNKQNV
jgi:GTPase SAR1 family protein